MVKLNGLFGVPFVILYAEFIYCDFFCTRLNIFCCQFA